MNNDKFLGHNGFLWFTGVVEDRNDPNKAGRVRVRALGHHTSNTTILPTADLPWAHCMLPSTSAGISGLGQSAKYNHFLSVHAITEVAKDPRAFN